MFKSSGGVPLVYYVFDLLYLEGKDLRSAPGENCGPAFSRSLPKIFGSPTNSAAAKMSCSGSRKSSDSRDWLPKSRIQSTKPAGEAVPGSNSKRQKPGLPTR